MSTNPRLERVLAQLRLYEHPLLDFDARAKGDAVEVIIKFKNPDVPVHTYFFELHPRDLDHSQFEWSFQRQLYALSTRLPGRNVHPYAARPPRTSTERPVTLRQKIEKEIRERGPIPFSRYMELCLYDPELGYYSRNAEQFGKAGDFYTSSDVHAVFGRLVARQFEEIWRALGSPGQIEILELGPGRGLFAQDVLDWSEKKFPGFFRAVHCTLAESSPSLRERLQSTLKRQFAAGKVSICSENPFALGEGTASTAGASLSDPIIVFANEFFDALPVEVLSPQGELRISEKDGQLFETWHPASAEALEFLDRYSVHPEAGQRIEAPLIAQRYMSQIATAVDCGILIAIDYGYKRQDQLAGRHRGTIAAYRQHSESANPYEAPGEQDITPPT